MTLSQDIIFARVKLTVGQNAVDGRQGPSEINPEISQFTYCLVDVTWFLSFLGILRGRHATNGCVGVSDPLQAAKRIKNISRCSLFPHGKETTVP